VNDELRQAIVRILDPVGNAVGTGFLADDRRILTCAHVVEQAAGVGSGAAEAPHDDLRVDFPLLEPGTAFTAHVVAWLPPRGRAKDRTPEPEDIAVLELVETPPGATPAPMTSAEDLWGHPFRAFGFPQGYDGGVWASGVLWAGQADGWIQIEDIKEMGFFVAPGFSGAPVWDEPLGRVVGMVVAADARPNVRAGFIIPMRALVHAWPRLGEILGLPRTDGAPKHSQLSDLDGETANHPIREGRPTSDRSHREERAVARIFISYHNAEPDLALAQEFAHALRKAGHRTFMAGESLRLGDHWPHRIDAELEQCEYFLLLLSELSATSEMVTEEVRRARQLAETRDSGRPNLLPVRVRFPLTSPVNYELRAYLSQIQQREWKGPADTGPILREIEALLASGEAPPSTENACDPNPPPVFERPTPVAEPELPRGQVGITSPFYVERGRIEADCYGAAALPGALLRIKAPRQMGKTSLLARVLHHADELGYHTVPLSFQLADGSVFTDLDRLLRWLCASVGRRLKLTNLLGGLWDDTFGSKETCTAYFEEHLFTESDGPIVLALDEVDRVFHEPTVAGEFFGLLRGWHETAKLGTAWERLRLIVVHSTEVYLPLNVNESPFNVGTPVPLTEFDAKAVDWLAGQHGLSWADADVAQLIEMVGGHPYLVRLALYLVARGELTLATLLRTAPTEAGPYTDHLHRHLWSLQQYAELGDAMRRVVVAKSPVRLESEHLFKLESLGLVRLLENDAVPGCELYRHYFREHLHA
jgi:hypothetical protein